MPLSVITTQLEPDALQLARRVWQRNCPTLLWSRSGSGPSYVACEPVAVASGLDPEPELALNEQAGRWAAVPRWVGVLPYEAQRAALERPAYSVPETRSKPLIEATQWWRYPAVAVVHGGEVSIVGDSEPAAQQLYALLRHSAATPLSAQLSASALDHNEPEHLRRIQRALQLIAAGDVYEINLARRLELQVEGSALALLARLSEFAQAEYCAACVLPDGAEVVCTSPELFLELEPSGYLRTVPIKGTRPRGANASEDARLRAELDADPKERAELYMVVDVERNDLGRVARTGSVRAELACITQHTTVFHRQAEVNAWLRADVSRAELLRAMLPSGSVTGAPKVRAMEWIRQLESERRGLYTGALGFVSHAGGMQLAMAIRTLCRRGELAHYFVGGGIVIDSVPEREVEETRWKAAQVYRALAAHP